MPTITLADADGGTELLAGWTAMPLSAFQEKIRAALIVEVATRKVIASQ